MFRCLDTGVNFMKHFYRGAWIRGGGHDCQVGEQSCRPFAAVTFSAMGRDLGISSGDVLFQLVIFGVCCDTFEERKLVSLHAEQME